MMPKPWPNQTTAEKLTHLEAKLRGGVWPYSAFTPSFQLAGVDAAKFLNVSFPPLHGTANYVDEMLNKIEKLTTQYAYLHTRLELGQERMMRIELDGNFASPERHFLSEDLFIGQAATDQKVGPLSLIPGDYIIRASGDYWLRMGAKQGFYEGRFQNERDPSVPVLGFFIGKYQKLDLGWEPFAPYLTPGEPTCSRQY